MSRGGAGRVPATRVELEAIFRAALAEVDAGRLVAEAVSEEAGRLVLAGAPLPPGAPLRVLAAGKAAVPMAAALEARAGARIAAGLAVTKAGHGGTLERIELLEAGHPVPDRRSERAGRAARALVEAGQPDEVLVVLLSGGASALLAASLADLSLEDVAETTRVLLRAGAPIDALNAVRKRLVDLAGGRLATRSRAHRIELLVLSDVAGDRLDVIGSGPFAPDPTTYADAWRVLERYAVDGRVPARVREHLLAGQRGEREETPGPGAAVFERVRATVLASNRTLVEAARSEAGRRGHRTIALGGELRGEAREVGRRLAAIGRGLRPPLLLLAGGETTVTVRGSGRGGRCQELALAAALELDGSPGVALLAAGSDGTDGPTDAAGAYADGGTLARARRLDLDPRAALARNDAYGFFAREGGILRTGPTGTNLQDLVLVLAGPGPTR